MMPRMANHIDVTHTEPLAKLDDERRLFGGWDYVYRDAAGKTVIDGSGDYIRSAAAVTALEAAFEKYATVYRTGDDQHQVADVSDLIFALPINDQTAAALGLPDTYRKRGLFSVHRARETADGERLWQDIKAGRKVAKSIVGTGHRIEENPDA